MVFSIFLYLRGGCGTTLGWVAFFFMRKQTVTIEESERFNVALRKLPDLSEDAVARLRESGAEEFVCSNYRQALQGVASITKYVRDFAGASSTAAIEAEVNSILSSLGNRER